MTKTNKTKGFSKTPKLKVKSDNKKATMARDSFTSTVVSGVNTDPVLVTLVQMLASEQSQEVRRTFKQINQDSGIEPKDKDIQQLGYDSTESRNIIKIASCLYDSQKELFGDKYLKDTKADIRAIKSQIKNKKQKLNKAKKVSTAKKLRTQLFKLHNKLNKKQQSLVVIQAQVASGQFSVCFGTKALQRKYTANLNAAKNTADCFESQELLSLYKDQKTEWQFNRDSEYFIEGHAAQKAGNQKIKLIPTDDGKFDLSIAVPKRLQKQVAQFAEVKNSQVTFKGVGIYFGNTSNYHDLVAALNPILKQEQKKDGKTSQRSTTKYPISHRLKLVVDGQGIVGVRIHTTIHVDKAPITTNRNNGCVGFDLNQHSLDWTHVDSLGNYLDSGSIPLSTQDRNQNQTKDQVYKATKQLAKIVKGKEALLSGEGLGFKNNSERFKCRSKKFARMASNLPFAMVRDALKQQCHRLGVRVKFVNPAFTSVIGLYKYMVPYGLSSGAAAGLVIARRALGLSDKIPSYVFSAGFQLDDGISATSWTAWGKLAKWRKTIGGQNRHDFFSFGRLYRVNRSHEDVLYTPQSGE